MYYSGVEHHFHKKQTPIQWPLFQDILIKPAPVDFRETRDDGVAMTSATCKSFASHIHTYILIYIVPKS